MSEHVPTHKDRIDLAKKIWAIAGESPVMGNALMDVLGEKTYKKIMRLQAENPEHQPNPVVSDKCYTPFEYLTEFFPDAIKDTEKPVCCTHENIVSGLRAFLDESGNAAVGAICEESELASESLAVPTTSFNTFNNEQIGYNYLYRGAALRIDKNAPEDMQAIRFAASMANSIGNFCITSLQNPFTISPTASSSLNPRCKQ